MNNCGCHAPSVPTGHSCGCSAPAPQPSIITVPQVTVDCCGNTAYTFNKPTCGCTQNIISGYQDAQLSGHNKCNCVTARIPSYPCGVSQYTAESARNIWNY